MDSNDPAHLGIPGLLPGDRAVPMQTCPRCECDYTDLVEFAGQYVCDPCVRAGMCKDCRQVFAVRGGDYCADCEAAFFCAHPAEFVAAYHDLQVTAEGRQVIAKVFELQPKMRSLVNYSDVIADVRVA